MDFYAELEALAGQIPPGRVALLADLAEALGDKAASIVLPEVLERIFPRCRGAGRVVKANGSLAVPIAAATLKREGVRVRDLRVTVYEPTPFAKFESTFPLRALREQQHRCADDAVLHDRLRRLETIAGLDVSYEDDRGFAAAVLLEAGTLRRLREVAVAVEVNFPYIPGYLAFRELPALLSALHSLRSTPSLLFVDGHGILHPAGCGIASQVGLSTGIPTIGVAKSLLVGEVQKTLLKVGEAASVRLRGRVAGYALRSSSSKHPIYISPGNNVTAKTALRLTRAVCLYRVPEPIRLAHMLAEREKMSRNKKGKAFRGASKKHNA